MALLCGYASELYEQMLPDWTLRTHDARNDLVQSVTECLWINPAAAERLFSAERISP
jgi:hypothetical protein